MLLSGEITTNSKVVVGEAKGKIQVKVTSAKDLQKI